LFAGLLLLTLAATEVWAQSGAVDLTFNPGDGVDLPVLSVVLQTNGQILIGGEFTSYNDTNRVNVARVNTNGSLDGSFDPSDAFGGDFPVVNALALQPNGQLLAGGSFSNASTMNLCRINTNASLDTNFTASPNDVVNALVVQTNGSVVIGGVFTRVNNRPLAGLARVASNGNVDQSFTPNLSGGSAIAYALALQTDGKILVAGSFTSIGGSPRTNIARLNVDGSLDAGFKPITVSGDSNSPTNPGVCTCVAMDNLGRVLVGGVFASVNGLARTNLARFNSDGSLDMNFNPTASTDGTLWSIALESLGKILIAGEFNMVNGMTNNYVAKLNDDGTLDPSFNTGVGPDYIVYSVALQSDGKIVAGGEFSDIGTNYLSGIGRLQNVQTVSPPHLINPIYSNGVFRASVPAYIGKTYILQFKNNASDAGWSPLPGVPGDGTLKTMLDSSATVARRFYRVEAQ
jgi:uncharacterized delta-60 repeat protein